MRKRLAYHIMVYFFLILWSIIVLFLIYWLFLMSLKTPRQQFHKPPLFFFQPTVENYLNIFAVGVGKLVELPGLRMPRYFLNSIIVSVSAMIIALAFSIPASYALARFKVKFSRVLLLFMLFTRMVPPMSILIPLFLIGNSLHLIDTHLYLIIVYAAVNVPFSMFLMVGFFQQVPKEIEECGMVDGLSRFGAMIKIAVPLIAPGIAATMVLGLWMCWIDFQFALVLTSENATMPVGIANLVTPYVEMWGAIGASGFAFVIPIVIFALLVQKHLVRGLTLGAIK